MTEHTAYWIWMQQALGVGAKTERVLSQFDTARALYESGPTERRMSGLLTASQADRLDSAKLSDAERMLERCRRLGYAVLTPEDEAYPAALRSLPDLPMALYVRGDVSCMCEQLVIALVGSRNASMYSLDVARQISRDLARAGAVIVSGGALGVDSAAHTGALYAKGKTVAVLGCGLNVPYLQKNVALREEIAQNGALISEYPLDTPAKPANFPLRNRIISGLSSGVLVIEAGEKSGSLITARYASEQGRDVFGVPGDLTSMDYTGVNRLIRDGAKPVFSARDVLEEYMWVYDEMPLESLAEQPKKMPIPTAKRAVDASLTDTAKAVYRAFDDTPMYADDLVRTTGFEPNRVFTALTELEICGFIKMIEGKRYTIV